MVKSHRHDREHLGTGDHDSKETSMATWAKQELARIGGAFELYVLTRSLDGALRTGIPIWQVRVGDAIYIKSAHGRRTAGSGGWCAPDSGALGRVALKRTSRSSRPHRSERRADPAGCLSLVCRGEQPDRRTSPLRHARACGVGHAIASRSRGGQPDRDERECPTSHQEGSLFATGGSAPDSRLPGRSSSAPRFPGR